VDPVDPVELDPDEPPELEEPVEYFVDVLSEDDP
jgi:hypothetical protein